MSAIEPSAAEAQHLTFFVGEGEYAVPVLCVREVVEAMHITCVPGAPPAVRGVVNLRGGVVPIIDLGARFCLAERPITRWSCIVVVMVDALGEQATMGLLVDAVDQVIDLEPSAIKPVPPFGAHVRVEFLKGMGMIGPRLVLLLDVDRVLAVPDLLVVAALQERVPAGDDDSARVIRALESKETCI